MIEQVQAGEMFTLCLMAIALSMDAFSVCIGLGMRGIRLKQIAKISILTGFFHMLMPFKGMLIGRYLSHFMGKFTIAIGGGLLIVFGLHMIYSSLFERERSSWISTTSWGLLLFAFGVSVDSFSVGLSLGFFPLNFWLSILFFGMGGLFLTMLGLLIGRKVNRLVGGYGEALGGIILFVFGIKFLL